LTSVPLDWPALSSGEWAETHDTLHLWLQMAGKVKLRLHPPLNQWWHVGLHLTSRGLTTGNIPYSGGAFEIAFDFVDHNLAIRASSGELRFLPLMPRSVADFYGEFMAALKALGVKVEIDTIPDELPEAPAKRTRFELDERHASYDEDAVKRWWKILLRTERVMDRYRSRFRGKSSPVLMWWGGMDLAQVRFRGRPAAPPPGANRMMRLAEDEENISVGFWPGNSAMRQAIFYSYTYPEPPGCPQALIQPEAARYHDGVREFVLNYDDLLRSPDPDATLLSFFTSTYEAGAALAGWERAQLEQSPPALRPISND
jgi:uncharacterized protein DUF5996